MLRSILLSTVGGLFKLIEWPFLLLGNRSRQKAQMVHLSAKDDNLDDYRIQMDQTKALLIFRRDALLPLIACLKDTTKSSEETERQIREFVPAAVQVRQNTGHTALALVPLVMQECENVDYRSEAGLKQLENYRDAIDDAERTTSARRQELRKQYPGNPLLMGTPETSVG